VYIGLPGKWLWADAEVCNWYDRLISTSRGGLLCGRCGVEDYDEEGGDGAEEQGNQKPQKAAAILRLREAGVDQAQGSPAGVIARFGERVKHTQMVARFACPERSAVFVSRVLHRGRRGGALDGRGCALSRR
jgi:hypothetical protein